MLEQLQRSGLGQVLLVDASPDDLERDLLPVAHDDEIDVAARVRNG
jgi:hypothetical protein